MIILSLFLSFTENENAKRASEEERVSSVRRRRVQQQRPKAFGKKKGPLSLSRSRETRFEVCVVCVPRVTNFERTVSCREKNEKMEQKHNHTVVGRVKERVVVVVVVKSEYTQAKSLSCSKCECSKILILRHV